MTASSDLPKKTLEPLEKLLHSIISRLEAIEGKVGIASPASLHVEAETVVAEEEPPVPPALAAYDEFLAKNIVPLVETCKQLAAEDGKMKEIGEYTQVAFTSVRPIIELASQCQKPAATTAGVQQALDPYLKPIQEAVGAVHKIRTTRNYDTHQKSIIEMLSSLSWVIMVPPPQTPSAFVSETLGATEFWSNKVRKQYKGVEGKETQITFCLLLKSIIQELAAYTKEYHALGLAWNPRGFKKLEEGAAKLSTSKAGTSPDAEKVPSGKVGGGLAAMVSELTSKVTTDGSSAATGLRRVTKEQQTWRKEYTPTTQPAAAPKIPSAIGTSVGVAKAVPAASQKPPKCDFDRTAQTWRVEHQNDKSNTMRSTDGGLLKLQVQDAKEQIYIYQCQNITIEITGKCKNIVIDSCSKVNVVFFTVISSCEVVNSKRIQVQTLGVCPSFSIDKTDGFLVYLSKETMEVTSFVTSKSSEMNVCWPDEGGDMKELPIPEQFHHKLVNGSITSTVSDLYH